MGPSTTGSYMLSSSVEAQIWSRATAEIPSPPDSPLLWSTDAGAVAAAFLRGNDQAWGDLAEALPHHALTAGTITAGKHRGPWCALCQMPVTRCIQCGCDMRWLRSPTPGQRRPPSVASRAPSRGCGPSRLGAASRASVNGTSRLATPTAGGAGLEELSPGFGSSMSSNAVPHRPGRWLTASPPDGSSQLQCDWQERPISPYAEELPSTMSTRLPPPTRSSASSMGRTTPSLRKPWVEDDLRSIRMCRSLMATPIVLRGDDGLEEFDKARRELNAEVAFQKKKEKLQGLAEHQQEWLRRSRRRQERKKTRKLHHQEQKKHLALRTTIAQEDVPEVPDEEEDSDREDVMQKATSWSSSRKTLRTFCMRRVQMNLRTDTGHFALHGQSGEDDDHDQASNSHNKNLLELEEQTHAMELTRQANEAKLAQEAFYRYDVDSSGTLELQEIRAVLEDLGLMPRTPEEKAGVRRVFLESVLAAENGECDVDDVNSLLDEEEMNERVVEGTPRSQARSIEERTARRLTVGCRELPALLEQIRQCLKHCRQKVLQEAFNRRDIFERGELDLASVKAILQDVDLFPANEDEEARFKSLLRAMRVHGPAGENLHPKTRRVRRQGTTAGDTLHGLVQELRAASPNPGDPSHIRRGSKERPGLLEDPTSRRGVEERTSRGSKAVGSALRYDPMASAEDHDHEVFDQNRTFIFQEFEIMVEFLLEAREQQRAREERDLAETLGLLNETENRPSWRSAKLFLEFRRELSTVHNLFNHFDEDRSGYLEINEIWECLITLGLMPKKHEEKVAVMELVKDSCANTLRADARGRRRLGGLGVALTWLYRHGSTFDHSLSTVVYQGECQIQGTLPNNDFMRINFMDFLDLISKIRQWSQASMREELRPLFERNLRKKGVVVSEVLCIPEVCRALEELSMAPTNHEEQKQIKQFFEDSNEWGFEPPTFDFETFVRLIRQVREWMHSRNRAKERDYAAIHLDFTERQVNHYRMAFDILDEGSETLTIVGVRKVFRLLNRQISSDQLRELFSRMDLNGSGVIGFLEFLHLVYELEAEEVQDSSNKVNEDLPRSQDVQEALLRQDTDFFPLHGDVGQ